MNFKTKFSIDDFVYPISQGRFGKFVTCKICDGKKRITINNIEKTSMLCPGCYGEGGENKWFPDDWRVEIESASKVGRINIEQHKQREQKTTYMIEETGIGSGTIWHEDRLFLSKEEAETECKKRNKKLLNCPK